MREGGKLGMEWAPHLVRIYRARCRTTVLRIAAIFSQYPAPSYVEPKFHHHHRTIPTVYDGIDQA